MSRPARANPLILVVEDDAAGRELVVEILKMAGFSTSEAQDGTDALRQAEEHLPDVVVLDWSMSGLDGLEVTRRLKAGARTKRIGVLVLTGHVEQDDRHDAMAAGCDVFLTKPCLPDILVREVRRLVQARTEVTPTPR